jgi:hypothetical protein
MLSELERTIVAALRRAIDRAIEDRDVAALSTSFAQLVELLMKRKAPATLRDACDAIATRLDEAARAGLAKLAADADPKSNLARTVRLMLTPLPS